MSPSWHTTCHTPGCRRKHVNSPSETDLSEWLKSDILSVSTRTGIQFSPPHRNVALEVIPRTKTILNADLTKKGSENVTRMVKGRSSELRERCRLTLGGCRYRWRGYRYKQWCLMRIEGAQSRGRDIKAICSFALRVFRRVCQPYGLENSVEALLKPILMITEKRTKYH